jgi:hypothetical protein
MANFLDQLASFIVANYADQLTETVIVLPSRRARTFLLEAIKRKADQPVFTPEILSVEEFVAGMANLRAVDNIELLFEFYEVYRKHPNTQPQKFEFFANWAVTILQDFNEIDRYLLKASAILTYLKDIEVLKRWGVEPGQTTTLISNYLLFWEILPEYYTQLYDHLLKSGRGYQGMIYREAVNALSTFCEENADRQFVFAGFNALNKAEEKIFQTMVSAGIGTVLWDFDKAFLDNDHHDAGMFLRHYKRDWPIYRSRQMEWIEDSFSKPKEIKIIGTPKTIGQARIAGEILESLPTDKQSLTAVVLGDENLLLPMLHSLPDSTSGLNITMGYPAKNNPVQILVNRLFRMHTGAVKRSGSGYVMYYKDVLEVLLHPLVEPYAGASEVVTQIRQRNYTFVPHGKLYEFLPQDNPFFDLLFAKWTTASDVSGQLSNILLALKGKLDSRTDDDRIVLAFLYAVYKTINQLSRYFSDHPDETVETLYSIYKQIIDLAEVSFEGEPLTGLQIMGVLESRTLDFDTVIITSLNEGTFPAGKSHNSFIPLDVKREYGLPTFKEKDAIYSYHFYHLLQRASKIYLLYNTESEGLDGGEKSRFLTQLEVEPMPAHIITHEVRNAGLPEVPAEPMIIEKTPRIMERLREIAEKGFSPSALTGYIRNPILFYKQRILRISDLDEVEESIALNTLGTIIHRTLETLYRPFIGVELTREIVEGFRVQVDDIVLEKFKNEYKDGDFQRGRNLLAFEVAKRNVQNFISLELEGLAQGDEVTVIALEEKFSRQLDHPALPYPVMIAGEIDRLEIRNGVLRILDYKTGKVEPKNMVLESFDEMIDIKFEKVIQVLAYAFLYEPNAAGRLMEAGIISFKNMKEGFMPFTLKSDGKQVTRLVTPEVLSDYTAQLANLLSVILDEEVPFEEAL